MKNENSVCDENWGDFLRRKLQQLMKNWIQERQSFRDVVEVNNNKGR
jgi:hypothetical protein